MVVTAVDDNALGARRCRRHFLASVTVPLPLAPSNEIDVVGIVSPPMLLFEVLPVASDEFAVTEFAQILDTPLSCHLHIASHVIFLFDAAQSPVIGPLRLFASKVSVLVALKVVCVSDHQQSPVGILLVLDDVEGSLAV